jgi:lipid-binding SYLF domain-containing protein
MQFQLRSLTVTTRLLAAASLILLIAATISHAADPAETIVQSQQVLAELIAIPGKQIPVSLLQDAQGVAIIPRVIKIGFVAGGRRGHGVVLVRDAAGGWTLPRFVTLTGGSLGWQAGVQGTDVVLVFTTQKSVNNLLNGKFTVGVDAAAAAGPVGRNAAAATDMSLQAEILSYSRSRGLFLGASIDGSAIEIDHAANAAFYASPDPQAPQVVPPAATQLLTYVMTLTANPAALAPVSAQPITTAPGGAPATVPALVAPVNFKDMRTDALRRSLAAEQARLAQSLTPEWQTFLALPAAVSNPAVQPKRTDFAAAFGRYQQIAADPRYASLSARSEFQSTMELLREYTSVLQTESATLQLPAPPPAVDARR